MKNRIIALVMTGIVGVSILGLYATGLLGTLSFSKHPATTTLSPNKYAPVLSSFSFSGNHTLWTGSIKANGTIAGGNGCIDCIGNGTIVKEQIYALNQTGYYSESVTFQYGGNNKQCCGTLVTLYLNLAQMSGATWQFVVGDWYTFTLTDPSGTTYNIATLQM